MAGCWDWERGSSNWVILSRHVWWEKHSSRDRIRPSWQSTLKIDETMTLTPLSISQTIFNRLVKTFDSVNWNYSMSNSVWERTNTSNSKASRSSESIDPRRNHSNTRDENFLESQWLRRREEKERERSSNIDLCSFLGRVSELDWTTTRRSNVRTRREIWVASKFQRSSLMTLKRSRAFFSSTWFSLERIGPDQ